MSMFKEEAETLSVIKHKHVVKLIGSGQGVLSVNNGKERVEVKKVEYVCLELLYDWNFYLNYISIPDFAIRKIFKKIVKTAAFIHSKGILMGNLNFENIKCNKQGTIKISNIHSVLQKPLPYILPFPFASPENYIKGFTYQSIEYALGIILLKMRFGPQLGNYMKCSSEAFDFHGSSFWARLNVMLQGSIDLSFIDLLQSMLCATSPNQFSFPQILSHPWISSNEVHEEQDNDMDEYGTADNL
jgi:serine/threonine protein kinase